MTTQEFSDAFDTLLASYNHKAEFGDLSSYADVTLDEYEKSVFLTQALDNVVKNYFTRQANSLGEGFDDSARRLIDFSSLIKVITLESVSIGDELFDSRSILYELPRKIVNGTMIEGTTDVLYILNEKLSVITSPVWKRAGYESYHGSYTNDAATNLIKWETIGGSTNCESIEDAESVGWKWYPGKTKDYVIVPISYKEYDREMSKPYALPLKKQAWRLFLNSHTGFDVRTELIPRFNFREEGSSFIYKIRYVKRPNPIILEDLPNDLTVDGESIETPCELNPILHIDILEEAVRLALNSKGIETRDLKAAREAAKNRHN